MCFSLKAFIKARSYVNECKMVMEISFDLEVETICYRYCCERAGASFFPCWTHHPLWEWRSLNGINLISAAFSWCFVKAGISLLSTTSFKGCICSPAVGIVHSKKSNDAKDQRRNQHTVDREIFITEKIFVHHLQRQKLNWRNIFFDV